MNTGAVSAAIIGAFPLAEGDSNYPESLKVDQVDEYFGTKVADPYRWLEEDVRESDRVKEWVDQQNEVTFAYLKGLPGRDKIEDRLTDIWNYEKVGAPSRHGKWYYYYKNDGLQNQNVLYRKRRLAGDSEIVFDPNTWSEDGTVALAGTSFSKDGRFVAYGVQESGSDWRTWKVRDLDTGEDLPDALEHLKFTGLAWDGEGEGFFYAKYPTPDEDSQFQSLNQEMKVMYHRLGADQSDDFVVHYRPDHPEWGYGTEVSEDGRYLILSVWWGTDNKYRILVKDLREPLAAPIELIDKFENDYSYLHNDGKTFYFFTDNEAPRGRIIAIDLDNSDRAHWQEIVPERDEPLESATIVHNQFVTTYLKDVLTQVRFYRKTGEPIGELALPGVGTASGFRGEAADSETFFQFQSYATPPSNYRYDFISGKVELLDRAGVDFDPDEYISEQVFYSSKDGTRVPLFITRKKSVPLDGNAPTLLYGYGGFNITLAPRFSVSRAAWLELGGVYAVANIRGGGEYGKTWHQAGQKRDKQNVFDDFIAAAENLVEAGYTRPDKLAIMGGSNGGLLVGAVVNQRPELFAAAIPAVGVMDMLRFDRFTAGRFWTDDYGSASDSKEMFEYLLGYSPYHNLKKGEKYPAILVTTADTDDRVVPGHSFKYAARLQEVTDGDRSALIRIETRAGHGSGKPTSKIIEEYADVYAFLSKNLGLEVE